MHFKVMIFAAAAICSTITAAHEPASGLPNGPHLITSGAASVEAMPDMATLTIEAAITARDAASAKRQIDARIAQYLGFLEQNGIDKQDIAAANLRLQPEFDYQKQKTVFKGYQAMRTVKIVVRQLDKANALLDGALKTGLTEIHSITPGVAQAQKYQQQAQQAAMAQATQQAQQLAQGFNSTLGPIYSVRYHAPNQPVRQQVMSKAMSADVMPDPTAAKTYEPTAIRFSDQVDVVFELRPAP